MRRNLINISVIFLLVWSQCVVCQEADNESFSEPRTFTSEFHYNYTADGDSYDPHDLHDSHDSQDSEDSKTTDGEYLLYDYESGNPLSAEPLVAEEPNHEDDEEVVILDENSRIVAEQLIQELDHISEKLHDDDETLENSRAVSPADINNLEKLLQAARTVNSSIHSNRKNYGPQFPGLGNMAAGLGGLGGLGGMGDLGGLGGLQGLGGIPPSTMTKRKIEEIKGELRHMLFGPDVTRRQGGPPQFPGNRRPQGGPISRQRLPSLGFLPQQPPRNRNFQGRRPERPPGFQVGQGSAPVPGFSINGGRPQVLGDTRNGGPQFSNPNSRNPVNEEGFGGNGRPQIPSDTRNVGPQFSHPSSRSPVNEQGFGGNGRPPVPNDSRNGGPPLPGPSGRVPIKEFRQQPSNFRLPADPSFAFQGPNNFNPPPNNFRTPQFLPGKSNQQPNIPLHRSPPNNQNQQQRQQFPTEGTPVFHPSEAVPRPGTVESEGFRPIVPNNVPKQSQPYQPQRPHAVNPGTNGFRVGASIRTGGNQNPQPGFVNRPNVPPSVQEPKSREPECVNFVDSVCLETRGYPRDAIMSLFSRSPVSEAMLADVRTQSADELIDGVSAAEERQYTFSHYYGNRREGDDSHAHRDFAADGGFLCPSEVRYAKPQLAQNSKGAWKYIVNVEEHTQTVRMEHCLKPTKSCSYVSPHYKSQCAQVYNYHRLLSWDEKRGLHIDIYKIPSACSCHINGYSHNYPPLDAAPFDTSSGTSRSSNSSAVSSGKRPSFIKSSSDKTTPGPSKTSTGLPNSKNSGLDSEFGSFMESHFPSSPFGSVFKSNQFGKRIDTESDTEHAGSQPVADISQQKTNYDYHPIIEFFQNRNKPKRS